MPISDVPTTPEDVIALRRLRNASTLSFAEYLEFLNDLMRTGKRTDALRHAPHDRSSAGQAGELLYGQDAGVTCGAWLGLVLWLRGSPRRALRS